MELWHTYMSFLRMFSHEAYGPDFRNAGLAFHSPYFFRAFWRGLVCNAQKYESAVLSSLSFYINLHHICFWKQVGDIQSPYITPWRPRLGTIVKNHILSNWKFWPVAFYDCSKYDTSLKNYITSTVVSVCFFAKVRFMQAWRTFAHYIIKQSKVCIKQI